MANARIAATLLLALGVGAVHADDAVTTLGKVRAAASHLDWEIRDANHPILGAIRFAHTRGAIVTPVGSANVFSSAYVSCVKGAGAIAIELTNQTAPDDPGGLRPATAPRLVCNRPASPGKVGTVQEMIDARWEVNGIGDALARDLRPAALRSCASIGIVQDVELPKGWARPTASIEFVVSPYAKALDAIFVTCGERSAYAAPVPAPTVAKARLAKPAATWKSARTTSSGRTNVRERADVRSRVVTRLDPGAPILVQSTGGDWYRVKPRGGARFAGYVREDRLVLP